MSRIKIAFVLAVSIIFLAACGGEKNQQLSRQGTAEAFVQAIIDGDEKTIEKLNKDQTNPASYIIQEISPEFSGIKLQDLTFEFDEENDEFLVENSNGSISYWLDVEKIGEKYFITKIV